MQMQLPAAYVCYASYVCHERPTTQSSGPFLQLLAAGPESAAFICRLFTTSCSIVVLETALFVSHFVPPVPLYQESTWLRAQCNVGHPALVSRARSRVY
jgi:hypothetical protein